MSNPFNPSFGKLPPIYIDRTAQTEELVAELKNPDSPYQTTLIYGQRGSGNGFVLPYFRDFVNERIADEFE